MNDVFTFGISDRVLNIGINLAELQLFKMPELIDNFWEYADSNHAAFEKVVFDMKKLRYLDSSALGFLVRVHIKLSKKQVVVILKNVHKDILKILESTRLLNDFNIE